MRRSVEFVVVGCAVFALALFLGDVGSDDDTTAATSPDPPVPATAQVARVAQVIDGDTAWVRITRRGGSLSPGEHRVRLLGIDSPELHASPERPECGAVQAQAFLRRLLPTDSRVWLQADRQDRDRFDRPLRYLWTADGQLVNRAVIAAGQARSVLFEPNDRYWPLLRHVEAHARDAGAGLWACPQR